MRRRNSTAFMLATVLSVLTAFATGKATLAGQANQNAATGQFFIGFWEGVDPLDGSTVQLSITDIDQDGEFIYLYRESFFSTCFDAVSNTKGRGYVVGSAKVVEKGMLEAEVEQFCVDDLNNPPTSLVEFETEVSAAPQGDILILPQDPDPVLLHRTSD